MLAEFWKPDRFRFAGGTALTALIIISPFSNMRLSPFAYVICPLPDLRLFRQYIIKKSVSECITLSVPYPLPDD